MKTIFAIIAAALIGTAYADGLILVDPETGKYLGNLNSNQYDPNSVSNPYGQYGSKYSQDSINNPYGEYGSPYSDKSPNNPYGTGPAIIDPIGNDGW